jgi:hypothetical protein
MMDNAPILTPGHGPTASGLSPHELEAVRARRASLRRSAEAVREVLEQPPAGDRPGSAGAVRAAVERLVEVWTAHSVATSGPDGVLEQVLADSPRLAPAIGRLRREHDEIALALDAARRLLATAPPAPGVPAPDVPAPDVPAPGVTELLKALHAIDRHRRDGRELLHNAYQVDLGLGE